MKRPLFYLTLAAANAQADTWSDFHWQDFTAGSTYFPHAVLLLPAKVDGISCSVQLDTGANTAFIAKPPQEPPLREVKVAIASHAITARLSEAAIARLRAGAPCFAGTVGPANRSASPALRCPASSACPALANGR